MSLRKVVLMMLLLSAGTAWPADVTYRAESSGWSSWVSNGATAPPTVFLTWTQ
jgi:hypothetical protein